MPALVNHDINRDINHDINRDINHDIKLFHISDNTEYTVDISALNKSKKLYNVFNVLQNDEARNLGYIVCTGDNKALSFIVDYLNFYKLENTYESSIDEIPPPEIPLPENTNLIDIFEFEIVFDCLIKDDITFSEKKDFINNIINIAEELEMDILIDKLSAIVSYYMKL